jgi:secreted trypsin-like serine protease
MIKTTKIVTFTLTFFTLIIAILSTDILAEASKPLIVGGEKSAENTRSWVVALVNKNQPENAKAQFCGGAIIGSHEILTAAHCIYKKNKSDIQVLNGTQSLRSGGKRLNVIEIIEHPNYNPQSYDNDLAILKLDKSPDGDVINLATAQDDSNAIQKNQEVIVAGWGYTKDADNQSPTELFEVKVPITSPEKCKSAYKKLEAEVSDNMICAGYDPGGKDACQGDSGGPLFIERENKTYLQIGIVSWGIGCAEPNKYGVYTRISKYISWIDMHVKDKCSQKDIQDKKC